MQSPQDPCCAKEVQDRRKALSLRRRLENVDRSTARIKAREMAWRKGAAHLCPCADPSCGPFGDYPLLAALRGPEQEVAADDGEGGGSAGGFVEGVGGEDIRERRGGDSSAEEDDSDAELEAMLNEYEAEDGEV